ncbi:MAG: hypothetical protein QGI45_08745 [Myxococcota bacterium]|jgi:hypothetical protein|nr:hypothetical protein [Myxococcota bacterium]
MDNVKEKGKTMIYRRVLFFLLVCAGLAMMGCGGLGDDQLGVSLEDAVGAKAFAEKQVPKDHYGNVFYSVTCLRTTADGGDYKMDCGGENQRTCKTARKACQINKGVCLDCWNHM